MIASVTTLATTPALALADVVGAGVLPVEFDLPPLIGVLASVLDDPDVVVEVEFLRVVVEDVAFLLVDVMFAGATVPTTLLGPPLTAPLPAASTGAPTPGRKPEALRASF